MSGDWLRKWHPQFSPLSSAFFSVSFAFCRVLSRQNHKSAYKKKSVQIKLIYYIFWCKKKKSFFLFFSNAPYFIFVFTFWVFSWFCSVSHITAPPTHILPLPTCIAALARLPSTNQWPCIRPCCSVSTNPVLSYTKWHFFIALYIQIQPIFEENAAICEAARVTFEEKLSDKRERVTGDLDKIRNRIEEFNDYCEMDMMGQYVQDVRGVQKRLLEAQVSVKWT